MAVEDPQDGVHLVRDRETYRYLDSSCIHGYIDAATDPIPPARPSRDSVLTALTQLAVHRLGARRAAVSLLDHRLEYVVSETTASSGLKCSGNKVTEEGLMMCGLAFPHTQGVSGYVLNEVYGSLKSTLRDSDERWRLPVVVVPDIQADIRFAASRMSSAFPEARFYAAVPIRSPTGPVIGILSLIDDQPRAELSVPDTDFLTDLSSTVMDHLIHVHHKQEEARGKRMMRGLGSFVEGLNTISDAASGQWQSRRSDGTGNEGMLNTIQQAKLHHPDLQTRHADDDTEAASRWTDQTFNETSSTHTEATYNDVSSVRCELKAILPDSVPFDADTPSTSDVEQHRPSQVQQQSQDIFSRASNIIRESIEVEGVLFFDASIATAGTLSDSDDSETANAGRPHCSKYTSSGDESVRSVSSESDVASGAVKKCDVLGFSTTETASIDGHSPSSTHLTVPERFLRLLLRRYPKGKIFNFDENGFSCSESESESDHDTSVADNSAARTTRAPQEHDHRRRAFARSMEPSFIIKIFPHARSVIAFPLWDSHRLRWYAGGVAWTRTPTRVFGVKGELSYLRAFGATIMAEIAKLDARQADEAKADVLGSISHELRSPLHGILGGVELLQETDLDVFQDSTVNTIERCSVTLLETVDHLLDFAKDNNHLRGSRATGRVAPSQRGATDVTEAKVRSTGAFSEVTIDAVVEEVVESMFAGHEFQTSKEQQYALSANYASADPAETLHEPVKIVLDMRPASSWKFVTQVGALRRTVMNIFGNALKYTTSGHIRVTLDQEERRNGAKCTTYLKFIVEDTGRGISKEFLAHHLFTPFIQEDPMAPGTGLGLSMTQKIVRSLGGTIRAQSRPGRGTVMSVSLPLSPSTDVPAPDTQDPFVMAVGRTRGLRVCLSGFEQSNALTTSEHAKRSNSWQLPRTTLVQQCQKWLEMNVSFSTDTGVKPDLYLATLAGAHTLAELNKAGDVFQPVVVICPTAAMARHASVTSKTLDKNGIFEYIAQPCGPRKLAKAFTLALDRWAVVQIDQASEALDHVSQLTPSTSSDEGLGYRQSDPDDASGSDVTVATSSSPSTDPSESPAASNSSLGEIPKAAHLDSSESDITLPMVFRQQHRSPTQSPPVVPKSEAYMPYLVVDDSAINVKLLTTYLQRQGLPFVSATDGALGLAAFKARRGAFSCIFMDVQMPNLDGMSATRAIREYERRERLTPVYIVMLTGLAMTDIMREAEASGVDDFFPKPVRLKALKPIIAKTRKPLSI